MTYLLGYPSGLQRWAKAQLPLAVAKHVGGHFSSVKLTRSAQLSGVGTVFNARFTQEDPKARSD